jgi:hypothetical protein
MPLPDGCPPTKRNVDRTAVHRDALQDEERSLRGIVAVPDQHVAQILVLEIDGHIGQVARRAAQRRINPFPLERLGGRSVDLEHAGVSQEFLTPVRMRIESGSENHDLPAAPLHGTRQRIVDEPGADDHHADDVDDFDLLDCLVVWQAQRTDDRVLQGQCGWITEQPFGERVGIPYRRIRFTRTHRASGSDVDRGPGNVC